MTPDPRQSTVDGILHRTAARYPARVALRFGDRQFTYRELDDAVTRAFVHNPAFVRHPSARRVDPLAVGAGMDAHGVPRHRQIGGALDGPQWISGRTVGAVIS